MQTLVAVEVLPLANVACRRERGKREPVDTEHCIELFICSDSFINFISRYGEYYKTLDLDE